MRLLAAGLVVTALLLPLPPAVSAARDFEATEADFECLLSWDLVGNIRVFHRSPRKLKKAVKILQKNKPRRKFPVGTILQLIPQEAMVKRKKKFSPTGNGWEFFELDVASGGTRIKNRGAEAVNFIGLECRGCHEAAKRFDFVCRNDHGCGTLPLTDEQIRAIQAADPRCR